MHWQPELTKGVCMLNDAIQIRGPYSRRTGLMGGGGATTQQQKQQQRLHFLEFRAEAMRGIKVWENNGRIAAFLCVYSNSSHQGNSREEKSEASSTATIDSFSIRGRPEGKLLEFITEDPQEHIIAGCCYFAQPSEGNDPPPAAAAAALTGIQLVTNKGRRSEVLGVRTPSTSAFVAPKGHFLTGIGGRYVAMMGGGNDDDDDESEDRNDGSGGIYSLALVYVTIARYVAEEKRRAAQDIVDSKLRSMDAKPITRDLLVRRLLRWFKGGFFKWTAVRCERCNANTQAAGACRANIAEMAWGAGIVELHRCVNPTCQHTTRFPRYNHPSKLMETRMGRFNTDVMGRRTMVSEQELAAIIRNINSACKRVVASLRTPNRNVFRHISEWDLEEQKELSATLAQQEVKEEDLKAEEKRGRQTGSVEWKAARGELGRDRGTSTASRQQQQQQHNKSRVIRIRVRAGLWVDQIAFDREDGSKSVYGGSGGSECPAFEMGATEYLTGVQTRRGDHLDAVRFTTNTGRISSWYGGSAGGEPLDFLAPTATGSKDSERKEEGMIVGLVVKPNAMCPPILSVIAAPVPRDLLKRKENEQEEEEGKKKRRIQQQQQQQQQQQKPSSTSSSSSSSSKASTEARIMAKKTFAGYLHMYLRGCGDKNCSNKNCRSSQAFPQVSTLDVDYIELKKMTHAVAVQKSLVKLKTHQSKSLCKGARKIVGLPL
eukprot:jgi/Bigna1/72567/fgenesh1_pg.20_\